MGASAMSEVGRMTRADPRGAFSVRLAASHSDRRAANALRYDVFVRELGGDGPLVDHGAGLEIDRFDAFAEQMILVDEAAGGRIAGVYRLMRDDHARAAGQFYSEDEYDLTPLRDSGPARSGMSVP
jgi:putative hemolysin